MLPMLMNEGALTNRLFGAPNLLPSLFDVVEQATPAQAYVPPFDCYETENTWELLLDAPGIAKEDLKLSVEAGVLTIRGSRKAPEIKEGSYRHNHRWAGEFVRTFRLGDGLDTSRIEASFKDGVLRVSIAKAESAKPREITIQS